MKITKRQLRRIIKEELNRLVERRDEKSPGGRQTVGGPTSAYDQGYQAGTQGNRDDMPLGQYGTPFYNAWMEGWDDGLAQFHGGGSY